jgi:hypothetical protein
LHASAGDTLHFKGDGLIEPDLPVEPTAVLGIASVLFQRPLRMRLPTLFEASVFLQSFRMLIAIRGKRFRRALAPQHLLRLLRQAWRSQS